MPVSQLKKKKQSVREQVGEAETGKRASTLPHAALMHECGMTE